MKRVYIDTPGKILSYRNIRGIRTPTFFDVEDNDLKSFRVYLDMMGVNHIKVENIENKDKYQNTIKKPTTGLKTITTGGSIKTSIKFSMK